MKLMEMARSISDRHKKNSDRTSFRSTLPYLQKHDLGMIDPTQILTISNILIPESEETHRSNKFIPKRKKHATHDIHITSPYYS